MIRSNKIRRWMGDRLAACATLLRIRNVIIYKQQYILSTTVANAAEWRVTRYRGFAANENLEDL